MYKAEEFFEMGLIDILVEKGEGRSARARLSSSRKRQAASGFLGPWARCGGGFRR